jgi:hypothetical protein
LAAAFLLLAVTSHWPYSFYVLLRVTICTIAVYSAYQATERKSAWAWIYGAVAVLFNPIIPIHMARSDWSRIDALTAIIFAVPMALKLAARQRTERQP